MKVRKEFIFITMVSIGLLLICSYLGVTSILGQGGEKTIPIIKTCLVFLSFIVIILNRNDWSKTKFSRFWFLWIIWFTISFFIFGLKDEGISSYFHFCLTPCIFFIFFIASLHSNAIKKISTYSYVFVFGLTAVLFLYSRLLIQGSVFGVNKEASNFIFWSLCTLPFLFLLSNDVLRNTLLFTLFLFGFISLKRSTIIILIIVLVVYYLKTMRNKRAHKILNRSFIILIIFGLFGYFILIKNLSPFVAISQERFESMSEDEGSGRLPLYRDVIDVMNQNDWYNWLLGLGYGSIESHTSHTNAHNDALQMLFEYGIIGLLFYLSMLYYAIRRLISLHKARSDYFMSYFSSLVIVIVMGMVSNLVVYYIYFAYITSFWGLIEGECKKMGLD